LRPLEDGSVAGSKKPRKETVGQRLRRLRLERGLSQRQLASPGVSYAYISRIEADARRPSVKALRKLALKLGVSPDELETGSPLRDADRRELRLAEAELALRLGEEPSGPEATLRDVIDEALEYGDNAVARRAQIALGLAAERRGDAKQAAKLLEQALDDGTVPPAARPEAYAALSRARSAAGDEMRADELARQTLADAGDPQTRVATLRTLAREATDGDRAEALEFARRALALLDVTEEERELSSLRAR
jgi:transcriptional regulator with XRE-family HTH domain